MKSAFTREFPAKKVLSVPQDGRCFGSLEDAYLNPFLSATPRLCIKSDLALCDIVLL